MEESGAVGDLASTSINNSRVVLALSFSKAASRPLPFDQEQTILALNSLLRVLAKSPALKISAFFSGFVLDILKNKPAILSSLIGAIENGQIELLAGLHYEASPQWAKLGDIERQIERSVSFWDGLGVAASSRPIGLWLTYASLDQLESIASNFSFKFLFLPQSLLQDTSEIKTQKCSSSGSIRHGLIALENSSLSVLYYTAPQAIQLDSPQNQTYVITDLVEKSAALADPFQRLTGPSALEQLVTEIEGPFTKLHDTLLSLEESKNNYLLLRDNDYLLSSCPEEAYLLERQEQLRFALELAPKQMASAPNYITNKERLQEAFNFFDRSLYQDPIKTEPSDLRHSYSYLLNCHVLLDTIRHSEIEPAEGWLEIASELEPRAAERHVHSKLTVENPFLCGHFSEKAGGLLALDYKPRKINLLSPNHKVASLRTCIFQPETGFSFDSNNLTTFPRESQLLIARRSPNLSVIRLAETITCNDNGPDGTTTEIRVFKNFSLKASLGAHLQDATSGFSLEYWLEDSVPKHLEAYEFSLIFQIYLPSGEKDCLSARPLLCVGAESKEISRLSIQARLSSENFPGGLYGTRLIDGILGYTIDLRSAKQLSSIYLIDIPDPEGSADDSSYYGTSVVLCSSLKSLGGDEKSNTIFFSTG